MAIAFRPSTFTYFAPQESRDRKWRAKQTEAPSKVQGLLGQCALATVAILGMLVTSNLQLVDRINRETERIPLSPLLL